MEPLLTQLQRSALWHRCAVIICRRPVYLGNYLTPKTGDYYANEAALREAMQQPDFAMGEFRKAVGADLDPRFVRIFHNDPIFKEVVALTYHHIYFKNDHKTHNKRADIDMPFVYHCLQVAYAKALHNMDGTDKKEGQHVIQGSPLYRAEVYKAILHDTAEDSNKHMGGPNDPGFETQQQILREIAELFAHDPLMGNYIAWGLRRLTDVPVRFKDDTIKKLERRYRQYTDQYLVTYAQILAIDCIEGRNRESLVEDAIKRGDLMRWKKFVKEAKTRKKHALKERRLRNMARAAGKELDHPARIPRKYNSVNSALDVETKLLDTGNNLLSDWHMVLRGRITYQHMKGGYKKARQRVKTVRRHMGPYCDERLMRSVEHLIWKMKYIAPAFYYAHEGRRRTLSSIRTGLKYWRVATQRLSRKIHTSSLFLS